MQPDLRVYAKAQAASIESLLQALEGWIIENAEKAMIDEKTLFIAECALGLRDKLAEKGAKARLSATGANLKLSQAQAYFLCSIMPPPSDWGQVLLNQMESQVIPNSKHLQPQNLLHAYQARLD
jgi:hypothetical protein